MQRDKVTFQVPFTNYSDKTTGDTMKKAFSSKTGRILQLVLGGWLQAFVEKIKWAVFSFPSLVLHVQAEQVHLTAW